MNLDNFKAVMNQTGPADHVSKRYRFVPTTTALTVLADHGWHPASVRESNVRLEEKVGFQSHIVRLRNEAFSQLINGREYHPEIVLKNSHNRGSAFQLGLGIWRQVCGNGLIATQDYGNFNIKHVGFASHFVEEAVHSLASSAGKMIDAVERFRQIRLSHTERLNFAQEAIELKFDPEEGAFALKPECVVETRRFADMKERDNLWGVFNAVQENLVKGGTVGRTSDGRRRRDRGVTHIGRNMKLNRDLWGLADKYAEAHGIITHL